jgi:hypothetical protein
MNVPPLVWSVLLVLSLLAGAPAAALAQNLGDPLDPLEERDMARARFEASQVSVKDLVRQRIEAIRECSLARLQEYNAGRGTLDTVLEMKTLLGRARQPLPAKIEGNREAHEQLWRVTWQVENLTRARYENNRVTAADYYHSVYERLDAELKLALSRPKKK